jgi:peptidoglycan/xylan/chitin deacetylase (PgdA/CDA1 family)
VLLYHSVPDEQGDRFAVARADFEAHMHAIARSGRVALSISELAAWLRGDKPIPDRAIAITFDDGFDNAFDVSQWLLERGLCSTHYLTTSEIGAPSRLSRSQVIELSRMPRIEIGAHSVRHSYLDELGSTGLSEEVNRSKAQLEDLTGVAVDSFAYPHGAYDDRVRRAVIEAGYTSAAGVKNALSHAADDPFAIARWTVTAGTSVSRIVEVIKGENVAMAWSHQRLRTRAYRAVRRARRRVTERIGTVGPCIGME